MTTSHFTYCIPPGRGRRRGIPVEFVVERELVNEDVERLCSTMAPQQWQPLKKLRFSHHRLAKMIAAGKMPSEISAVTGHSAAYIGMLKNDPAFAELIVFYEEQLHEIYIDVHQRMATFGTDLLEELQERFQREPEKFTKRELMDLFVTMADRSIPTAKGGPAPQQGMTPGGAAPVNLQFNFVQPPPEAPAVLSQREGTVEILPPSPTSVEPEVGSIEWKQKKLKEALEKMPKNLFGKE